MVDYFSDNMRGAPDGATVPTVLPAGGLRAPAALVHGRKRIKRMQIEDPTDVFAAADVLRMGTFKSSDRIGAIFYSEIGNFAVATVDIGIWLHTPQHTGAVVEAEVFTAALAIGAARADQFDQNGLGDDDRWKMLWELVNIETPATYAADPHVQFELGILVNGAITGIGILQLEVEFTAGATGD